MGKRIFSALIRFVDWSYPTNRAITFLSLAVALLGTTAHMAQGIPFGESVKKGLLFGVTVFLAWALGREVDPDHPLSAFLGAGFTIVMFFVWELPHLLLLFWVLLALRMLNRSVGHPVTIVDDVLVLGLMSWLVWQSYWGVGVFMTAVFMLDQDGLQFRHQHNIATGLAFVLTLVLNYLSGDDFSVPFSSFQFPAVVLPLLASGIFLWMTLTCKQTRCVADVGGKPLDHQRVQTAQVFGVLAAWGVTMRLGAPGIELVSTLWVVLLGAGIYQLGDRLMMRRRRNKEDQQ